MIIAGESLDYAKRLADSAPKTGHQPYSVVVLLEAVTWESYGTVPAGHYVVVSQADLPAFQHAHKSKPVYTNLFGESPGRVEQVTVSLSCGHRGMAPADLTLRAKYPTAFCETCQDVSAIRLRKATP